MKLPPVTIATSVRYGYYKEHYQNALFFVDTITKKFDEIRNYITLPKKLLINIRPVRDAYGRAFYLKPKPYSTAKEYIVEIDARQSRDIFEDTLLHELVHIEQFYEGRLIDAGPMHFKWRGKSVLIDTSSLDIYNNLPWEREAIERASMLKQVIFK